MVTQSERDAVARRHPNIPQDGLFDQNEVPTPTPQSVYDTSKGRCREGIVIAGRWFQCSLAEEHEGWSHGSVEAEAIWK